MKAHSETHFENENMFLEKWKVIKEHRVWLDSWMFCYTWYKSFGARELEDSRRKKSKAKNQHSQNLSHFENESTFQKRIIFWKWKLIPKPILKMKTSLWKSEK